MIRLACTAAVALAVGFVGGHLAAGDDVADLPSGERPSVAIHAVEPSACAARSDVERLEHDLTEALMALRDAVASPQAEATTTLASDRAEWLTPDTAESFAADQRLHETVDVAIAAGRWTVEDAQLMRQLLIPASPAAAREARLAVTRAVNRQELSVDPHALRF